MPQLVDSQVATLLSSKIADLYHKKPPQPVTKTWWNANWTKSERITIDHLQVEGDLTDFPVLIWVASDDLKQAQTDGDDFVFVQDDNETVLHHEIERFNSTSGELLCWVNIPFLSSSEDTIFYIYFGNENCENQQQISATWNQDYLGVYHMNQPNSTLFDSAETQNATSYEDPGPHYQQPGKIGYSAFFGGYNGGGYFLFNNDAYKFNNESVTIEAWAYFDKNKNSDDTLLYLGRSSLYWPPWPRLSLRKLKKTDNEGRLFFQCGNSIEHSTSVLSNQNGSLLLDQWLYIVGVIDYLGNRTVLYINGVQQNQTNDTVPYNLRKADLHFKSAMAYDGMGSENNWNYLGGNLDEIRISQTARTDAWIQTSYNNMNDPQGFCIYGKGYTMSTRVDGHGTIQKTPNRSTYAENTVVELHALPEEGWIFEFWTGDLTGSQNPDTITMNDNKLIIAHFLDITPPHITNVIAEPTSTQQGNTVNITGKVTDNHHITEVKTIITYPDETTKNATMTLHENGQYYSNLTYNQTGTYSYYIWANDRTGNQNTSATNHFTITRNPLFNDPPSQPTNEQPENNAEYHTVYNVTLSVNVSDPDEDVLNVTFYWANQTPIATVEAISTNSTASIYLPEYLEVDWLNHGANYSWYVTISDNSTTTNSSIYTFSTSKAWDVNEDRTVNYLDMSAVSSRYGESVTPGSIGADINNDGKINYLDVSALSAHYGETY